MAHRAALRHSRRPPEFVTDKVYDNEQDPQHDIFVMRLDEFAETDGFRSTFREGWKRRDDFWTVTNPC